MPNWCNNKLNVSGPQADMKRFDKKLSDPDGIFHLNGLFPMPEQITKDTDDMEAISNAAIESHRKAIKTWRKDNPGTLKAFEDARKLDPKTPMPKDFPRYKEPEGYSREKAEGWYSWRCDNWGVKWECGSDENHQEYDECCPDDEEQVDSLLWCFDSPWSPPIEWLTKVAADWPTLIFKLEYFESGMCFAGEANGEEGKTTNYFHEIGPTDYSDWGFDNPDDCCDECGVLLEDGDCPDCSDDEKKKHDLCKTKFKSTEHNLCQTTFDKKEK